jgi:2,5-dihydroxypyridine 5,6-dioxygenase
MSVSYSLYEGWQHLLTLCEVQPTENAVILVGDATHPEHLSAARLALAHIGTPASILQLGEVRSAPSKTSKASPIALGPTALARNTSAIAAMKAADIVVDLFGMYRGAEQRDIQASGTRVILVKEPPETFLRHLPQAEDRRRIEIGERLIRASDTMRVTSKAGTDFTVKLGEFPPLTQYGYTATAGRWDHCPSTFVASWPNEGSSNGTVVLAPGDVILPFKQYVRTPIRLTIKEGFIREIEGDYDAHYLREYMAGFNDPEGYAVAHLGWGMARGGRWTTIGLQDKFQTNGMESRSSAGNFMFSTGQNADIGGKRHTACHLDIPMQGCSIWLDSTAVVQDGQVVESVFAEKSHA